MSQDAETAAFKLAQEFLAAQYEKIRLLRQTDKSEVWLASDKTGKLAVLKLLNRKDLPYARLKELDLPICPQIYYFAETAEKTFLVEEYIQEIPLWNGFDPVAIFRKRKLTDLFFNFAAG